MRRVAAMSKEAVPYIHAIEVVKDDFTKAAGDLLKYNDEAVFAMQALMKNDFSMKVANGNPQSVKLAMRNVAATGLSLNPAHGYAYLVPRDSAIVLDISYKGLIKIATDAGSVLWARADIVCEQDQFTYNGPASMPQHSANVFRDRGEVIGVYCIAKTADGDILTEVMDRAEIDKIRGKSDLYAKRKSGPWVEWFVQMCKKAVIKRASKTWPYTDRTQRMLDAIELANQSEGGYTLESEAVELIDAKQAQSIRDWLNATETPEKQFLKIYKVEAVEALPKARYQEAIATLQERQHAAA